MPEDINDEYSVSINGISIIDSRILQINEYIEFVKAEGLKHLLVAFEKHSQSDIGDCLQIFYNLNQLPYIVDYIINRSLTLSVDALKLNCAINNLGDERDKDRTKPGSAQKIDSSQWKITFWKQFPNTLDIIYNNVLNVWTLQRVLERKEDLNTHNFYISALDGEICSGFWLKLTSAFEKELEYICNSMRIIDININS